MAPLALSSALEGHKSTSPRREPWAYNEPGKSAPAGATDFHEAAQPATDFFRPYRG